MGWITKFGGKGVGVVEDWDGREVEVEEEEVTSGCEEGR